MPQDLMEPQVTSIAKENFEKYIRTHDVQYVAEDAVFVNLSSGEETRGRKAIGDMLHFIYHVAFDARAELINSFVMDDKAVLEGYFIGKHIGEINGIPATGNMVKVPLIVSYDMENGLIKKARIYMLESVMKEQLTS